LISRRDFITVLGGMASWPLASGAQQPQIRLPLVGALWHGKASAAVLLSNLEGFQRGLREEGYLEGQNISIQNKYGEDLEGLRNAANELVGLSVDVILAGGTPAALAAKRATSEIPIVGGSMADAVADGLVMSLAQPGGNITGNSFIAPELGPKRMQLLRELVPEISRIAALQHPGVYSEKTMVNLRAAIEEAAKASGVELQFVGVSNPNDFDNAFGELVAARTGALIILPSPMFYVNYRRLVDLAARHRLPTMFYFREAVEAGGLMCYGADIPNLFRLAAKYVAKILKGAKPSDLPVEQPVTFDIAINLKTAKTLGLTFPSSLLLRADQVIE
jgi:putative tryptophan/tyrosine transport system substrate-binding protein